MRNNQPVTQREYPVPGDGIIVSHTDASGRITHANDVFIDVSGFSREEIVGQPHNIVRHPDMPAEAFRDLWDTLKRGRPWSALVKNRRKNGDHYWVRANASPAAGGGFISVRVKPGADEVRAAEALYAKMRGDASIMLHEGRVLKKGLLTQGKLVFEKITIAQRFWFWAALASLLFYAAVGLGWYGLSVSSESLRSVHADRLVPLVQLVEIRGRLNANYAEMLRAFQHNPATPLAALHDHAVDRHLDSIAANVAVIDKSWQAYKAISHTEDEKRLAADFETKRSAWLEKFKEARTAVKAGNYSLAVMVAFLAAGRVEFVHANSALQALADYQLKVGNEVAAAAEARYKNTRAILIALLVIGATIGSWIGFVTLGRLKAGFAQAGEAAKAIAGGDLIRPVPVSGADEIGQLLAQMGIMRNNLHELVAQMRQEIVRLNTQSKELTGVAHDSSTVAERQSEAASSMAAAVEELSVSIDQVEEHASDARRVTQSAAERSTTSASVIQNTAAEMHRITEAVTHTAGNIRELEAISGRISGIVNVIKEIADQTNLLALNAAIEAARAGEQGRGFAVVADEVRKLAERTASSTGEITTMIKQIQDSSHAAVTSMEASVACVEDGVRLAGEAGESISQIRESTGAVTAAVDGISFTLKEQAVAAREIAGRVEHVSQGTEELAARARQTASSAGELEHIAAEMESLVSRFRV